MFIFGFSKSGENYYIDQKKKEINNLKVNKNDFRPREY